MVENPGDSNASGDSDVSGDDSIIFGRSSGSGVGFDDAIDPAASVGGSVGSGSGTGKKRGRKPGAKNKASKPQVNLSGIEKILFSGHMMLAAWTRTPQLMLTEKEAADLTKAITDVSQHYVNLDASEKTVAWINLAFCAGQIYGPRIMVSYINRKAGQARQAPPGMGHNGGPPMETSKPQGENVVHFAPGHFAEPPDRGTVG